MIRQPYRLGIPPRYYRSDRIEVRLRGGIISQGRVVQVTTRYNSQHSARHYYLVRLDIPVGKVSVRFVPERAVIKKINEREKRYGTSATER